LSKAVTNWTRSGGGKIVFEHYDKLIELWGGSANTTFLSFGVISADFLQEEQEEEEVSGDFYLMKYLMDLRQKMLMLLSPVPHKCKTI